VHQAPDAKTDGMLLCHVERLGRSSQKLRFNETTRAQPSGCALNQSMIKDNPLPDEAFL
jgi:hypothetical protein